MISQSKSLDIYLFLKRRMARERAVYRTRAQVRRLRVFNFKRRKNDEFTHRNNPDGLVCWSGFSEWRD